MRATLRPTRLPRPLLHLSPSPCLMRRVAFVVGVFALSSTAAVAGPAPAKELTAAEIVDKALSKGAVGFKQGSATLQMTLVTAKGEPKARSLEIKAMRGKDGMLRSMVRFTKPADVNGTTFLVVEKKDALPDQYVYVPKAKIVRRITAGNASSSFFGSDFTFADLMPLPVSEQDKVDVQKIADAEVGGQPVYVLQVTPKIEGAPYGRVVAYVHKELMLPVKIEFFDPQKAPLKTMRVKRLQKVGGEQVPVEVEMKAESGSRTDLVLEQVDPNAALTEADFTEEAMQR
ncbi:MAG: outer membrane lipoprotein-sorting protein [Deltaproteobacteria bacterium]|nr:outer membrane lipoprotein-sorting protein [Deltaproteobacteria bacterium]